MRSHFRYLIYLYVLACFSCAIASPEVDFFRAVNVDDDRTVKALLAQGFNPNTAGPAGLVGLHLAMREGSAKVAAALLSHPAIQIDATTPANETPLMMAALRGNLEWTRRLLERGAALNRAGWTPLHYAATGPELKVVQLLLDRGADIEAGSPNRSTPLMMAARYGPSEVVELLLARGASAKALNDRGLSAADMARGVGRESLALELDKAQGQR